MTLLATYQNHPAWISSIIACGTAALTFAVTTNLLVVPKTEKITALQQENKKLVDDFTKLELIKNSAEQSERVITNALAKAQNDADHQTQNAASIKATKESLESELVRWQTWYKTLSAQAGKLQETCNAINHITAISAQKDDIERKINFQLDNKDKSIVEEYRRRANELQARLLKLETGLACSPN